MTIVCIVHQQTARAESELKILQKTLYERGKCLLWLTKGKGPKPSDPSWYFISTLLERVSFNELRFCQMMVPVYTSLQIVPSNPKRFPGEPATSPIVLIKQIFATSCVTPESKGYSYLDLAKDLITKSQLLQKLASQLFLLSCNSLQYLSTP